MPTRGPKVLVVDDSADIRKLVRAWGRRNNFDVIGEAVDGLEAVEQTKRLRPDVVVLDVEMPGGNGLDAIPAIKHGAPNTQVVMFSAYPERKRHALKAGADAWVTMSGNSEPLIETIHRLAGHK